VAATTQVISAVIVVERTEEGHALPKAHYPQVQKLLYAVVLA
jgi:hypothetical protein